MSVVGLATVSREPASPCDARGPSRRLVGGRECGARRPTAAGEEAASASPSGVEGGSPCRYSAAIAPQSARREVAEDDSDDAVHPPDEDGLGWQRELVSCTLIAAAPPGLGVAVRVAPGVSGEKRRSPGRRTT